MTRRVYSIKVGDEVRLRKGHQSMTVMAIEFRVPDHKAYTRDSNYFYGKYGNTGGQEKKKVWCARTMYESRSRSVYFTGQDKWERWRPVSDFVPHDYSKAKANNTDTIFFEDVQPEKEDYMSIVLYETLEDKPRFGSKVAVNSKGQIVLEMKGRDGEVEAFDPDKIKEVVPYTVSISQVGGGGSAMHVQMPEGSIAKNEFVINLSNGDMFRVTAIDTRCRKFTTLSNPHWAKLVTEPLMLPDTEA